MNQQAAPQPWHGSPPPELMVEPANGANTLELWLAAAAVFLAPFNFLRPEAFYFTASDVLMIAAVFARLFDRSFAFSPLGAATPIWNGGVALLSSALLLSSLAYGDPDRGLILWAQYSFGYLLLPYVILSRPWPQTTLLMKAFAASITIMCLHGIYVMDIVGERNTTFVSGSGRLLGFVERENECAALIALATPVVLWLTTSGHAAVMWRWLLLPLFAYGVALTGSNTGLIGLVLGVAAFVVLTETIWRVAAAACVGVTALVTAFTWFRDFLPDVFQRRVLGALESGDLGQAGTFSNRMDLIHEAMSIADQSLVLGFGADQYRLVSEHGSPVHNTYLLIWTEAGLIGLVGFVLLLLTAATLGTAAFSTREGRASAACTLTMVCLFAAMANAFAHLYGRFFVVPLLLGIAPSVAVLRYGRGPRRCVGLRHRTSSRDLSLRSGQNDVWSSGATRT